MNNAIIKTIEMLREQIKIGNFCEVTSMFSKYSKIYINTNENINAYMSKFNFENKVDALAVLSSGDHSFNLICNGILNIDTFDSNVLTKYYVLGLKRAAILKFNYQEYIIFWNRLLSEKISLIGLSELIMSLFPYMDEEYRFYWMNVVDANYKMQVNNSNHINLFYMLTINFEYAFQNSNNNYLLNEENYDKLRNNLIKANISFRECDCLDLPFIINKTYDFIFLSNIADYFYKTFGLNWDYSYLEEIKSNFNYLLKDGGVCVLSYLIGIYSEMFHKFKPYLISKSNVCLDNLTTEKILLFDRLINNKASEIIKDGILLQRKL